VSRGPAPLSGNYWSADGDIPDCPICLESVQWACETACGHAFCAPCFLRWSKRFSVRTVTCPLDRRPVQAVYASAALRRRQARQADSALPSPATDAQRKALDAALLRFNERHGAGWLNENVRWAWRALRQWRFVPLNLRVQLISLAFFWVVYVLLPTDLFPEVAPPAPSPPPAPGARPGRRAPCPVRLRHTLDRRSLARWGW